MVTVSESNVDPLPSNNSATVATKLTNFTNGVPTAISINFTDVVNRGIYHSIPALVGRVSETNAPDNAGLAVFVTVQRQSDGKYYNGNGFIKQPTQLPATLVNGVFTLPQGSLPENLPGSPRLQDDTYILTALGTDRVGTQGIARVTLIIDHTPPTITIATPADSTLVRGITVISGKATDAPGGTGVQKVLVSLVRASDGKYFDGKAFVTPPLIKGVPQAPTLTAGYDPKTGTWAVRTGLPTQSDLTTGLYRNLSYSD